MPNTADIENNILNAEDKGEVHRQIPIDETLAGIIADAIAFKKTLDRKYINPQALFVNMHGNRWNRMTLLHAAQRAWEKVGLPVIKIHELRHTLGTEAGKLFPIGVIQVLMGHRSRKSSENYFHPHEEMAVEARKTLVRVLSGFSDNEVKLTPFPDNSEHPETPLYLCPILAPIFNNNNK